MRSPTYAAKAGTIGALPIGPKTLKAMDGYMRKRAAHKDAQCPFLWLGGKGRLSGSGIRQMLKRRCREAGTDEIHPDQLRHSSPRKGHDCWWSLGVHV